MSDCSVCYESNELKSCDKCKNKVCYNCIVKLIETAYKLKIDVKCPLCRHVYMTKVETEEHGDRDEEEGERPPRIND